MIIASVGVLGDSGFARSLTEAAEKGRSRLTVPAGAVGGLDALRAARLGGLDEVCYTGRKPPLAWTGTPAEAGRNLALLVSQEPVFNGNASEAVRLFPKNANVTAAVAMAGIGFDRTRVTLIADPAIVHNQHEIEAEGSFGRFRIVLENRPLAGNPKTSELAALSVAQAVIGHFQTVDF
jgi:aspartate dehydrogenase